MVPRKTLPKGRTQMGFTLIELLVVIAIIAILAAILFPVFAKVREKANQSTCAAHQRQLAIMMMAAAQDNDETFPLPGDWITAVNVSSDPKVFNCPSTSKKGVPSDPDYGVNAYLYTMVDGQPAGLPLGEIADPTKVQLTTDIKSATPKAIPTLTTRPLEGPGAGTDNYPLLSLQEMTDIEQSMINPFPSSFTCTGFEIGNGDKRHSGAAIVTFVDGHSGMQKNLSSPLVAYGLPSGNGRMFVDFSTYPATAKGYQQARFALAGAVAWTPSGAYDTSGYNAANAVLNIAANNNNPAAGSDISKGWKITGPGSMALGFDFRSNNYVDMTGLKHSLYLEGTMAAGTTISYGSMDIFIETSGMPAQLSNSGDLEHYATQKAIVIDEPDQFVQGGSLASYAGAAHNGYNANTWVNLPKDAAGKRTTLPSISKFTLELMADYGGTLMNFPTEAVMWNYNAALKGQFSGQCPLKGNTIWTLTTATGTYTYSGPFIPWVYEAGHYNKFLTVRTGLLTINKIGYATHNQ